MRRRRCSRPGSVGGRPKLPAMTVVRGRPLWPWPPTRAARRRRHADGRWYQRGIHRWRHDDGQHQRLNGHDVHRRHRFAGVRRTKVEPRPDCSADKHGVASSFTRTPYRSSAIEVARRTMLPAMLSGSEGHSWAVGDDYGLPTNRVFFCQGPSAIEKAVPMRRKAIPSCRV